MFPAGNAQKPYAAGGAAAGAKSMPGGSLLSAAVQLCRSCRGQWAQAPWHDAARHGRHEHDTALGWDAQLPERRSPAVRCLEPLDQLRELELGGQVDAAEPQLLQHPACTARCALWEDELRLEHRRELVERAQRVQLQAQHRGLLLDSRERGTGAGQTIWSSRLGTRLALKTQRLKRLGHVAS